MLFLIKQLTSTILVKKIQLNKMKRIERNSVTLNHIKKIYQSKADTNCGIMLLNYLSSLIMRAHQIRPLGSICLRVCKYVYVNICTFCCFT